MCLESPTGCLLEGSLKTGVWTDGSGTAFFGVAIATNQTEMADRPREPRPDCESPKHADTLTQVRGLAHGGDRGVSDAEIAF